MEGPDPIGGLICKNIQNVLCIFTLIRCKRGAPGGIIFQNVALKLCGYEERCLYIDIGESGRTVMDNKKCKKERLMRRMKRFMAFALSAAMMLTTVNMPEVTAWAQDDSRADVAELAADEAKTPVSAEMTATKTVFPYGEKLCLDRFVKVDVTYEDGTTENLAYRFDSNGGCYSAADDYGNDYKFMFGTSTDNMAEVPSYHRCWGCQLRL